MITIINGKKEGTNGIYKSGLLKCCIPPVIISTPMSTFMTVMGQFFSFMSKFDKSILNIAIAQHIWGISSNKLYPNSPGKFRPRMNLYYPKGLYLLIN